MTTAVRRQDSPSSRLLLTVDEAADMLNMGRTTVFDQIRRGRLKSVKLGRARRIPLDYITDFIDLLKTENHHPA